MGCGATVEPVKDSHVWASLAGNFIEVDCNVSVIWGQGDWHIAAQYIMEMLTTCFTISQVCLFVCVYLSNDYVK